MRRENSRPWRRRSAAAWLMVLGPACFACAAWLGCVPVSSGGGLSVPTPNTGNGGDGGDANGNANDNPEEVTFDRNLRLDSEGEQHISAGQQATYDANPPASGPHWSQGGVAPVEPGFYADALEEEQWIHNLEHGYVVFLYDCSGECSEEFLADMESVANEVPLSMFGNRKVVVTPYDGLPGLITAVAWERQRHMTAFDRQTLLDFYNDFVDRGPESAP